MATKEVASALSSSHAFELTANRYFRISDWTDGENGKRERVYNGTEIELGTQVPYIPSAKLYAKSFDWSGTSTTKGKHIASR